MQARSRGVSVGIVNTLWRNRALKPMTASIVPVFVGAASAAKGNRHQWRLVLRWKPIAAEEGVAKVLGNPSGQRPHKPARKAIRAGAARSGVSRCG